MDSGGVSGFVSGRGFERVEDAVGVDCKDIYWRRREERVRQRMEEVVQTSKVKEIIDL